MEFSSGKDVSNLLHIQWWSNLAIHLLQARQCLLFWPLNTILIKYEWTGSRVSIPEMNSKAQETLQPEVLPVNLHVTLTNLAVVIFDNMISISFFEFWFFAIFIIDSDLAWIWWSGKKMENEMKNCYDKQYCWK